MAMTVRELVNQLLGWYPDTEVRIFIGTKEQCAASDIDPNAKAGVEINGEIYMDDIGYDTLVLCTEQGKDAEE